MLLFALVNSLVLSCTAHAAPQPHKRAERRVFWLFRIRVLRVVCPTQGGFGRLLRVNQNGFTFMSYALESESNLIHFPGGALAKSKVFTYALTRG